MFTDNLRSRGYLPHFDRIGQVHTIRTSEVDVVPPNLRTPTTPNPYGACRLGIRCVAEIVIDALKFQSYRGIWDLYAYVVMPNHVHVLARVHEPLDRVIGGVKSFAGLAANQFLGQNGRFLATRLL
jgi:hypothetical protein